MNTDSLIVQIKSIETQLAVLKAQEKQLGTSSPPRTFGDLEGILAGHGDFTEEEIDAALIRFKWEDEQPEDEPE